MALLASRHEQAATCSAGWSWSDWNAWSVEGTCGSWRCYSRGWDSLSYQCYSSVEWSHCGSHGRQLDSLLDNSADRETSGTRHHRVWRGDATTARRLVLPADDWLSDITKSNVRGACSAGTTACGFSGESADDSSKGSCATTCASRSSRLNRQILASASPQRPPCASVAGSRYDEVKIAATSTSTVRERCFDRLIATKDASEILGVCDRCQESISNRSLASALLRMARSQDAKDVRGDLRLERFCDRLRKALRNPDTEIELAAGDFDPVAVVEAIAYLCPSTSGAGPSTASPSARRRMESSTSPTPAVVQRRRGSVTSRRWVSSALAASHSGGKQEDGVCLSSPYLGSPVRILTESDLVYEGQLAALNTAERTITLHHTRELWKNDRAAHGLRPSSVVHEVMVFKSSDVSNIYAIKAEELHTKSNEALCDARGQERDCSRSVGCIDSPDVFSERRPVDSSMGVSASSATTKFTDIMPKADRVAHASEEAKVKFDAAKPFEATTAHVIQAGAASPVNWAIAPQKGQRLSPHPKKRAQSLQPGDDSRIFNVAAALPAPSPATIPHVKLSTDNLLASSVRGSHDLCPGILRDSSRIRAHNQCGQASAKNVLAFRAQQIVHANVQDRLTTRKERSDQSRTCELVSDVLAVLAPLGFDESQALALIEETGSDPEAVQAGVDRVLSEHRPDAASASDWTIRVTRKTRRQRNLEEVAGFERKFLEHHYGSLEDLVLATGAKTPSSKIPQVLSARTRSVDPSSSRAAAFGGSHMRRSFSETPPLCEAASTELGECNRELATTQGIDAMTRQELRVLLKRVKTMSKMPDELMAAAAHRAVNELARCKPITLNDAHEAAVWHFDGESDDLRSLAGLPFFEALAQILLIRLQELHPICIVYALCAMALVGFHLQLLFHESARALQPQVHELPTEGIARLFWCFARARVQHSSLFASLAKETVERLKTDIARSYSPANIKDIIWACSKLPYVHGPLLDAILHRAAQLLQHDPRKHQLAAELCNPRSLCFRLPTLVALAEAIASLRWKPEAMLVGRMADYCVAGLSLPSREADQFIGKARRQAQAPMSVAPLTSSLRSLRGGAVAFLQVGMHRAEVYDLLKASASRRRGDVSKQDLSDIWKCARQAKLQEEKVERAKSAPPSRQRGATGRATLGTEGC